MLHREHIDEKNNAHYDWGSHYCGAGDGTGLVVTQNKGHRYVAFVVCFLT